MNMLIIKTSNLVNIVIIAVSLFMSYFAFLFGISNLINPDVADAYLTQNTVVSLLLCGIGVAFLILSIGSFRGIMYRNGN